MSETPGVDILQPLPIDKWNLLQNKLKYKWPYYAYHYYWIETSLKWKKRDPNIAIEIYCPYGNYENGTFIGINHIGFCSIVLLTLDPNDEILNKMLTETNIINWNKEICFASVHGSIASNVLSSIENLKSLKKVKTSHAFSFNYYFKSAEDCAKVEIKVPDGCYTRSLNTSDVPLINSVWPHRNPVNPELSMKYLSTVIELNGGIGLCLREDDTLVSWAMQPNWCTLGIVQTVEEHKGKGYAKVVVNLFAKKLGEEGIPAVLFIVQGNVPSEKMFKGLGWQVISPIMWIECGIIEKSKEE
ncbi:uncharacterized protein LOC108624579 [Ceratina calcarata]|uniref:Uncharacterized protein LOC108624579 n=1 Tax=Ceratina calcarata TaxID=156304 RepID=A0AAJ7N651_9HYME|nr:uncharacterized protein LOC108624579 [Ceratina calcarata]